jgi:hypothetical protein
MARSIWRRGERFVLGIVFGFAAWIIERQVLKAIRRRGEAVPTDPTPLSEGVSELERPAVRS